MSSRTRTRYGVDAMSEGDWLVRGTDDPMRALALIVEHGNESASFEDMLDGVAPGQIYRWGKGLVDNEPNPKYIAEMADWCHTMLATARPGYYRKNPCSPYSWESVQDGWTWMLGHADGPARGAFLGVYFRGY